MESASSQYLNINEYLTKHSAKAEGCGKMTHTRIGNKDLSVYGGSYHIAAEELSQFYQLYYDHVFVRKNKEYLTEKQLDTDGPILVDLDFRYNFDVNERQHSAEHVSDLIQVYLEELQEILQFTDNVSFPIFVMEKPSIKKVADKQLTKDGIHMIIGIKMDNVLQQMLRKRVLKSLADVWDLPFTNSWEEVLDEGISKGCVNWQMYGSRKPGMDAYKLTYYTQALWDAEECDFTTTSQKIDNFINVDNFQLLSAQYSKHIGIPMNSSVSDEYSAQSIQKLKKSSSKSRVNIIFEENCQELQLSDINNHETLRRVCESVLSGLKTNEQHIREIHEYTQILPEKYYKAGSHVTNRMVAFALKHTDERLFLSWVMLRAKADDFDYSSIPELFNQWQKFGKKTDGVTKRSIMYWAKQDAFEAYKIVKKTTIDNYIEETLIDAGDWDYAQVLFHMFKDKYVCTSLKNKSWFVFERHRWERDEGQTLRLAISKDLFQLYSDKRDQCLRECQHYEPNEKTHERLQTKIKKIAEICIKLKKTNDKNNIMREAMEIFFDKSFVRNMDSNPYLLCFTNGVFDFKQKIFRQGYPQDYITKTTNISFTPYDITATTAITEEINVFMSQLFPKPDVCEYMWNHLAATLIGIKKEQVFNIYRGSGSNGKSILTELMSQCLGDYKGTVPITLVTEKRGSIGGTSSEVIQLKGVRYAVMQEPSVGAVINEGILKELTGGDPIQARALYSESEIFMPQFSLIVNTNTLFDMKSQDDGTWRRMKLVDFISKFRSVGETYTDDTEHVFTKDKGLKEKLPQWAQVFISMLVKRACETEGEVSDCPEVIAASTKYRQSQDCINGFIVDMIVKDSSCVLGVKVLNNAFKEWFQLNYGTRRPPKLAELEEIMAKKFGNKSKDNKWAGIRIRPDDDDNNVDEIL